MWTAQSNTIHAAEPNIVGQGFDDDEQTTQNERKSYIKHIMQGYQVTHIHWLLLAITLPR